MKFLIVGLGSMGRRRVRLLKQYEEDCLIIGIDSNEERRDIVKKELGIETFSSIREAFSLHKFDGAFVCTSPKAHYLIMKELLSYDLDIFSEINLLSTGYEEFIGNKKQKLFLSSTFLYREDISWIINKVSGEKVNYTYHVGQYLPDWHPWESYKDFFVSNKETNGCRELMAIELPWLIKCFGKIAGFNVLKDKITDLEIDYPDNYMLMINHENGSKGIIAVDVVSRKATRKLEIFNQNIHVFWDGTPESLKEFSLEEKNMVNIPTYDVIENDKRYAENIIENAYYDEIDAFISWIKGDSSKVKHTYEKDLEILKLIDVIEG